ncbi:hypothetical protein [Desulfovibrio litoralis]|uniref:Phage uncharacterized protein (Putative large terminase), C-terminal domain-containing protein n=1 Tax=Desulfovibrio litoralis DSM 11393 TaxID=1121455 RepID=A0A1M7SSD0_9BACT|nr:hypothetical protein [Desulfovibrio litoralis]SHN61300.1 phage uncharacterized protein (putative large terminase), C-terminal domain-containing protein [Desulfovibrio litoralis DSM 11393]
MKYETEKLLIQSNYAKFITFQERESFYLKQFETLKKLELPERLAFLATIGKNDLYFLLTQLLKRHDLRHQWLYERCNEVMNSPNGYLDLWAREHYKSTIITFGLTIQSVLNDPELTVGIFSHTRTMAKNFLSQIKREFEQNILLKLCYPNVLWKNPQKEAPLWSLEKGLILKRKNNPKEASLEGWGLVDGQPIGKHFSLLIYDDVVTKDSVNTAEQSLKTTEAWALSLNLGAKGGKRRYIGTRYHLNDTYQEIINRKAAKLRIYPATHNGETTGTPVLLTPDILAEKRREMGAYIFGCQMLQNPLADEAQSFKETWLRFWSPEFSEKTSTIYNWQDFNRYILVDPAGEKKKNSDYTVMLVVGLGADQNWYIIDAIRDRLNLKSRATALFNLHKKYLPELVGYEKYGMQADIEFIESEQEHYNYRFPIISLGGSIAKNSRIKALAPYFEQGRIYLPKRCPFRGYDGKWHDFTEEFIKEEFLNFPVSTHDDMLDCLARILDQKLGAYFPTNTEVEHKNKNEFSENAETEYNMLS